MQPCAHIRECPRCAYTQPCSDLCESLFADDTSTCYIHHCPRCGTRMVVIVPRASLSPCLSQECSVVKLRSPCVYAWGDVTDEFQEALDMPEVNRDPERTASLEAKIYLLESVKLAIELEQ